LASTGDLFLVLKIGGSLVSEKDRYRHADRAAIRDFARLVAQLSQHAPGRIALVVGGGSFGHGAVRALRPGDAHGALDLTEAMFTQKWMWAEALRDEGVGAVPLQLTAMCTLDDGQARFSGEVVSRILSLGLVPIVSGDCLVCDDGAIRVFGSDNVPQLLLSVAPPPIRIVALTDVAGIVSRSQDGGVLREVDPDQPDEAFESLWPSAEGDTTGGMEGKLRALVECAKDGAECVILKGDAKAETLLFLLDEPNDWPSEITYTRIRPR
jgi:isopentenyl phosphate kinase